MCSTRTAGGWQGLIELLTGEILHEVIKLLLIGHRLPSKEELHKLLKSHGGKVEVSGFWVVQEPPLSISKRLRRNFQIGQIHHH
jgi:hypothetical protein